MTSESLNFLAVVSLFAVVAVLWQFADSATYQASQIDRAHVHVHAHTPSLTSDVWTVIYLGFR